MSTVTVSARLSSAQLSALHSLIHFYAPRFLGQAGITMDRGERLAWASDIVGRPLESFSALNAEEATRLIELMKRALGQEVKPAMRRSFWRRPDRDQAQAYGTAGRRSSGSKEIKLVDAPTLALIDKLLSQLGWSQIRFDAFLKSRNSPVRNGAIRTLAEANRVIWALRNMLRNGNAEKKTTEDISTPGDSSTNQFLFDFTRQREEG
jgi:hypothetical protein